MNVNMSNEGSVFFLVLAGIALAGAFGTVMVSNALRSAVSLLVTIVALAGIYLTLNAHLLSALQLIVYAGAVVVLFVFVIMLIGPTPPSPHKHKGLATRAVGVAFLSLAFVTVFNVVGTIAPQRTAMAPCRQGAPAECGQFGGLESVGRVIFREAWLPFELASLVLLVAIVGAIGIARSRVFIAKPLENQGVPPETARN